MTIHHATIKRAEKLGLILTELEATGEVEVHYPQSNKKYTAETVKQAMVVGELFSLFGTEYTNYQIRPSDDEEGLLAIYGKPEAEDWIEILQFSDTDAEGVNDIYIDTLETAQEMGISLDSPTQNWVVVPRKYKEMYKAGGHPDNCGDWLALFCEGKFNVTDDGAKTVFDPVKFEAFLKENGVDFSGKWASLPESGQSGWQGRYRMNGRQKLEKILAKTGVLIYNGNNVIPPKKYLKALAGKHPVKKAVK